MPGPSVAQPDESAAIDALARQMVAEVSPAELPLFSATAKRYHADPQAALTATPRSDERLGIGVESAVVLIAPFALELARRVLTKLSQKVGDDLGDSLAARISRWFGRGDTTRDAGDETEQDEPLSAEQLAAVAETARSEAAELSLPPEQCQRLADAVVATLATRR